jgi:Family of unknown function (DUF5312)
MKEDDLIPVEENQEEAPVGFVQRIFSFFLAAGDPEREKRRLLKDIGRQLRKQKYKFYRPKTGEALPGLAKFFHDIYVAIGPAQVLLDHAASSSVLKQIIIERSLTDQQVKIREGLAEDKIRALAQTMDHKALVQKLKEQMVSLYAAFDSEKVKQINGKYNLLKIFLQFIHYDYYFLLKKFDSGLPERDFIYNPRFEAINGEYIGDDLKDFLEVAALVDRSQPWGELLDDLQIYREMPVVDAAQWKKTVRSVAEIKSSLVLELIIRHIDRDPYYKAKLYRPNEHIVEEYLSKIKTGTELTVQKILKERRSGKIEQILMQVFGTVAISRMKNYTEKNNVTFSKKMMAGFAHVSALNYLKAFLLDYFKKDIREVVDQLLIRGKWSTNLMSQQLSDAFHTVMNISDQLIKFDDSLGDEGDRGIALRNSAKRADRDAASLKNLREQLKKMNDEALQMIQVSAQNLIVVGKSLKVVIEDYDHKPHELILNWKEIDTASDNQIRSRLADVYKRIYYFIQLLQFFAKKE